SPTGSSRTASGASRTSSSSPRSRRTRPSRPLRRPPDHPDPLRGVPLRLTDDDHARVAALDAELRTAAEAIGAALAPQLKRLTPALAPQAGGAEPEAVLTALDLDHEGAPDPLSLAACVAAHRAYVAARGRHEGVS